MKLHNIEQAITRLSQGDLVRLRRWFEKFYAQAINGHADINPAVSKDDLNMLRGKYKGKGLMKAFLANKKHDIACE